MILLIIRVLRPIYLIRFDCSYSSRIGHFAGINSLYISENFKKYNKNTKQFEFFIHEHIVSNSHIKKLLSKKIFFLPHFFYPILILNKFIPGGNKHLIHYRNNYYDRIRIFTHRDIDNLIDTTPLPVNFESDEINKAKNDIKKFGLNENDKIIILNIRDENYLKIIHPNNNWNYKTQNSDIRSYKKTIEYLINNDYKVIRCGLHHKETLKIDHKNYIDLFTKGLRTPLIENYLTSISLLQIGSYSGGTIPAHFIFRKPIVYCNFIPLTEMHMGSNKTYFILKKIYDKKNKTNISTSEYFDLLNTSFGPDLVNAANYGRFKPIINTSNLFSKYNKEDFKIVDNTEDEILDVVLEALSKIENSSSNKEISNLENKEFINVFLKNLEKYPILKKFHPKIINCNLGQKFLQNNNNFLL